MSVRKFKNNDEAILNSKLTKYDQANFNAEVGDVVQIINITSYGYYHVKLQKNEKRFNVKSNVLDKLPEASHIEQFEKLIEKSKEKIEKTQEFIDEVQNKINYLKETQTEIFNENEFKAFQTLTIIENSNMSKMDKAKAIASLISQK